jgi:hypothetical protein
MTKWTQATIQNQKPLKAKREGVIRCNTLLRISKTVVTDRLVRLNTSIEAGENAEAK